ncbi:glycosyltransferase family 2 protein [Staphylococcus devriesei]|uniref:glycosyltransferase family 2 protein n=1 Tax=Staphylococcus devriesei TaxID=586733 RepID=UPI0023B03D04|nr:glycosyltransferase [Staphylococcus devriesei]
MKVIKKKELTNKIKVSVLISTYNKEKFIETALDSILNQTMDKKDFEIIVVDDCSTDNTFDVVSRKIESFANYNLYNSMKIQVHQQSLVTYRLI